MKKLLIIFLLVPAAVFAQTGDAGSGWANFILNQLEWAKTELRENEQLAKTIELVKIYQDTKQLTGVVASTVKDLTAATKKFQEDIKKVDDVSESQLEQVTNFLSYEDALTGRNYPSLTNLSGWYADATATFRDNEGHLNATSLLYSSVSLEQQMKKQRAYYATLVQIRAQKAIYTDREISRLLHAAQEYDLQARHLVYKLNRTVFSKSLSNVEKGLGKVFKKDQPGNEDQKVQRSEAEIQAQIAQVYELQDAAARARGEALDLMYELMRMDMNSRTVDLLAIRRLRGKKLYPPEIVAPRGFLDN